MRSLAAPLIAAFPLLLAALASASPLLGVGDWRDEVAARGLVSLGSWGAEPEDFRVLVCTGDPEYQAALRDGVLEVRIANGGGPATLWIAIAAANPGALPVTVEGVRVEASRGVSYEAYLYGPLQGLDGSPWRAAWRGSGWRMTRRLLPG